MRATLIISVYKNVPFLKTVLDTLHYQTVKDFEIIISEDGEDEAMKNFIKQYPFEQKYKHITQKDEGWRKNTCLNNAIKASQEDWLIFIDGDCVLHGLVVVPNYAAQTVAAVDWLAEYPEPRICRARIFARPRHARCIGRIGAAMV